MCNDNFLSGFLKQAMGSGLKLTSGADFIKKINSKLKSPIQAGASSAKVVSGVSPSSYNQAVSATVNQQVKKTPAQIAAQNARNAAADVAKQPMSNYAKNAIKSTGNAQGLRQEMVGDMNSRK